MSIQETSTLAATTSGSSLAVSSLLQDARVLVVDDSRLMRMALMRALTDLGVQHIKEAKDGRDALTKIREASFDLMLLDMEMPEMTGIELLLAIKAEPELGAPPVIVISSVDQIENAVQCIEAGRRGLPAQDLQPDLAARPRDFIAREKASA